MKHEAWDSGAIRHAFLDVLGMCEAQKTTKTRCGRRVTMDAIDNDHPDCPDCLAEAKALEQATASVKALMVELGLPIPEEKPAAAKKVFQTARLTDARGHVWEVDQDRLAVRPRPLIGAEREAAERRLLAAIMGDHIHEGKGELV